MLPRLVPDSQRSSYDPQDGQQRVLYTSVWASRALGPIPEIPYANGDLNAREPKNSYENIWWALFIALLELGCALAVVGLSIYHWITETSIPLHTPEECAQLLQTGSAASFVAFLAVIAFSPGKQGRITKRLVAIFTLPVIVLLVQSIVLISSKIALETGQKTAVNGFYLAEVILVSLLLLFHFATLYPAGEAAATFARQRSGALSALSVSANTVTGAVILIYFCFSIYGLHYAFDPDDAPAVALKIRLTTSTIPTTSLLLLSTLGAFTAVGRGLRPHMVPTLVASIASLTVFFQATGPFVHYLNNYTTTDWRNDAYLGMFVLNWLSIAGLTIVVSLGTGFAVY